MHEFSSLRRVHPSILCQLLGDIYGDNHLLTRPRWPFARLGNGADILRTRGLWSQKNSLRKRCMPGYWCSRTGVQHRVSLRLLPHRWTISDTLRSCILRAIVSIPVWCFVCQPSLVSERGGWTYSRCWSARHPRGHAARHPVSLLDRRHLLTARKRRWPINPSRRRSLADRGKAERSVIAGAERPRRQKHYLA